ncbi:Uncharacterised protein [Shigella sonnei]|nr:Uncharacterised protein [Shigella sonnei]
MYMVLQVHINVEATNNIRTLLSCQPPCIDKAFSDGSSTRATDGSINAINTRLSVNIPAAIENITVKP